MANPAAVLRARVLATHPEAVIDGRGKTWIRHKLPDAPDGRQRFALDSGVGVLHYGDQFDQEINTSWVTDSGAWQWRMIEADYQAHARNVFNAGNILEYRDRATDQWVIFDPQSINWINQDNSRQQIAIKQAVNAVVSGDVMNFPAAYGAGRHFKYKLEPGQLQKLITIDSAANLPAPTVTGTIWFEAEFSLSHSAGVGLWLDGVKWAKTNGVRVRSANRVEFRDEATGQNVLWVLDYPRAYDSGENQVFGEIEVRRQGGASNLFITVRIPKTFFDTAVYPVFIDPTVDAQVAASADDAHESTTPAIFTNAVNVWLRISTSPWFAARAVITGPASGDTIDVAYATYIVGSNGARDDVYGNLMCENVDNAAVYTDGDPDNISTRSYTSTVAWAQSNTGPNAGDPATSPSIVTPVQAVIDRAGWASGNYLAWVLNVTDTGGTTSFNVRTYDDGSSLAPAIHIEYTAGGGLSGTINQNNETDSAQPFSKSKSKLVGQPSETDTAQSIARAKSKAIGINAETDTAQPINRAKAKTIGQAEETNTAQPLGTTITQEIAQVTETDAAQSLAGVKSKTIGINAESDTAQAILSSKVKSIGQSESTETAQPITAQKSKAIGQVIETDSAQSVASRKIKTIGQATESDVAQPITSGGAIVILQAEETDTALAVTPIKQRAIGQPFETDIAQPVARVKIKIIGQATEIDFAQAISTGEIVILRELFLYPRTARLTLTSRSAELKLHKRTKELL